MEQIKPRRGPKAPRRPRVADRLELQEQVTEFAAQLERSDDSAHGALIQRLLSLI
jgi:hypothetical protein